MPPALGRPEDDQYFCNCEKCARRGGQVLPRTTWYNHNRGGKKVKRPNLSLAEVDYMLSLPAPKLSKRRKKNFRGELEELRTRVAGRAAGSDRKSVV